ncbi:transposase [Peijinzhouia sedimentorum]
MVKSMWMNLRLVHLKKNQQGIAHSNDKVKIVLPVEYRKGKAGRAYAKVIEDFSSNSIKPIFEEHINQNASMFTDGWSAYKAFREEYRNLRQIPSNKRENFLMLRLQIRNFKNWLRGIRSYSDRKYLQKYINKYFFRFNRRNHRETTLIKLILRCVEAVPITKKPIIGLAT